MEFMETQIGESVRNMRFDRGKKSRPKFNQNQCDNLRHAFVAKISKFCSTESSSSSNNTSSTFSSKSCLIPHNIKRRVCVVSQCMEESALEEEGMKKVFLQRAWRELLRVIREAEVFLEACCSQDWWKRSLAMAATGEAHVIHLHDLLWSILCLDSSIEHDQPTYDGVCCRRLGEFYAEMNNPSRLHGENADRKQLIRILRRVSNDHDQKNALKKIILSSTEEDNRASLAKFLLKRLQKPTNFIRIDSRRELKLKGGEVESTLNSKTDCLCSYLSEASWLGMKVGIAKTDSENCKKEKAFMIYAELHNPFVVQIYGVSIDGDVGYVVTEISSTNLEKWIEEKRLSMPLHVMVDIMLQVSRGMEYLHGQRIIHLDLRPCSILFEPSSLKEFRDQGHGRVRIFPSNLTKSTKHCVNHWMAPETYDDEGLITNLSPKADIYSFGMICYYILTGKRPFEETSKKPTFPTCPSPSLLSEYLLKCWDVNPVKRPNFDEISGFLRYMKLLSMRIVDPQKPDSYLPFCKEFDRSQISSKFLDADTAKVTPIEDKLTMEEEGLIIRALDGDFPESFGAPDTNNKSKFNDTSATSPKKAIFTIKTKVGSVDNKAMLNLPCYLKRYTFVELHKITKGFNHEFSCSIGLWKAMLHDSSHATIKLIDRANTDTFLNELRILSMLHHPNIIRLHGYCIGTSKHCLVYNYMALDSLDKRLFSKPQVLTWNLRKRIALGVARGLTYVHKDCRNSIIGLKIDTRSILLDERFSPKLCGFCSVRADPEACWSKAGHKWMNSSQKQDEEASNVYSFGVLLIELLSGMRSAEIQYSDYYWIHESLQVPGASNAMEIIVDDRLKGDIGKEEAMNMINLGLWCLMKDPSWRPSFSRVLMVMEGLQRLGPPPLGQMEVLPPSLASHHASMQSPLAFQTQLLVAHTE